MTITRAAPPFGGFRLPHPCLRAVLVLLALLGVSQAAPAASLAPGFTALPRGERILLAPLDVELFSISAGGVVEPRSDWTLAATALLDKAIRDKVAALGMEVTSLPEDLAIEHKEAMTLHAAVARAISIHHDSSNLALPTKGGQLDWSFGDAFRALGERSGARYALFTWLRDSYTSGTRKMAMFAMAALGVGLGGGVQVGYASLVDLQSGQVLWFHELGRARGDLRDEQGATETVEALLQKLPAGSAP